MIEFKNVSLTYPNGFQALKNIDLTINDGEFVVIVGLSGAGKSTLIRSINLMVRPNAGELLVDGDNILKYNENQLRKLRTKVGMIFQQHNLVKRLTVFRNVLTGRLGQIGTFKSILGLFSQKDRHLAFESLTKVGIEEKAYQRADQLSGGQQQRVSIARALTQQPKIILADEPVSSLDPPTAHIVMKDLKRINTEEKITTIVNLHAIDLAIEYADRIIGLREGNLVFDGPAKSVSKETFEEIYGRPIRQDDIVGGVEE